MEAEVLKSDPVHNELLNNGNDFVLSELDLDKLPDTEISYGHFDFYSDAANYMTQIPGIVIKGAEQGPTVGLMAAVHGNELQGMSVIHELVKYIDPVELKGNIIAIPIVNMHGYLTKQRQFIDARDLNRVMPGKELGTPSEMFSFRFFNRILKKFDYLCDIHTASFGRENSHYIRADLSRPEVRKMALLQRAPIIVNTRMPKGSFRQVMNDHNIPTITLELGNPQLFQETMIDNGIEGISNLLIDLDMIPGRITPLVNTVICKTSYWLRVDTGGVLYVKPNLLEIIEEGQEIAYLTDLVGRVIKRYYAPETGIVVGKSTNPVTTTGGRILHIGIPGDINELYLDEDPAEDEDDYDY
jgi:predicted deacylase